jgi:hypothetical protein
VLRTKLALILGAVGLAAVSGPLALLFGGSSAPAAAPLNGTLITQSTAAAQIVAVDFLNGRATHVPVANGSGAGAAAVSSNFASSSHLAYLQLAFAGSVQKTDNSVVYELDKFLVETTTGMYTLSVPMRATASGPVLGAAPSLSKTALPFSNAVDPLNYSSDQGFVAGNTAYPAPYNGNIQSVVNRWATAYASNNQHNLQVVTQYTQQITYPALGHFTASLATIQSEVPTSAGLYARVEVRLHQGSFATNADYDVLILNPNTANPSIVSWGAAGSAPLTRF